MSETNFDKPELVVTDNMRNLESAVQALIRWLENISVEELAIRHKELGSKVAIISSIMATIGRNDLTLELSKLLEHTFGKLTELKATQQSKVIGQSEKHQTNENIRTEDPEKDKLISDWSSLSERVTDCFQGQTV